MTGGDSGIGRAVALAFAQRRRRRRDRLPRRARRRRRETKRAGRERRAAVPAAAGDIGDESVLPHAVERVGRGSFGRLDILVNNAAEQHPQEDLEEITDGAARAHVPHQHLRVLLPDQSGAAAPEARAPRSSTRTSVTAYRGSAQLIDYSATKGAIVAFTRSLAHSLVEQRHPRQRRRARARSGRR